MLILNFARLARSQINMEIIRTFSLYFLIFNWNSINHSWKVVLVLNWKLFSGYLPYDRNKNININFHHLGA